MEIYLYNRNKVIRFTKHSSMIKPNLLNFIWQLSNGKYTIYGDGDTRKLFEVGDYFKD